MAKAKKPAKPKQAISKTEQKKRQATSNAASKSLAQQEREMQALKDAKLEQQAKLAYDKELRLRVVQAAKAQARLDAAKEATKRMSKGKRK
ncbi:hypothetical protein [Synechococcus sp. PROS-U-1]|uniref:hypothetical protein n=1 Tax=Synechococcus sp. PROS-U-1 TaxID=1400866 RepID=UPI0016455F0A|nr:hypothetical protein [Synechococcus sp. PROS-U-1]